MALAKEEEEQQKKKLQKEETDIKYDIALVDNHLNILYNTCVHVDIQYILCRTYG